MARARVAPVSVKDPVMVVVGRVWAADLATRAVLIGVGAGRVTALVPAILATGLAIMAPLADRVPALWVRSMDRAAPGLAVTSAPVVDRVPALAPWVRCTVRVFPVTVSPGKREGAR
jgi:hypothetical protein